MAPIMLDYFDALAPTKELVVTFQNCVFQNNRYFGREAYAALIFANSNQNRLIVERSTFQNNDMVYNNTMNGTDSFLIESLGPTCIDRTCFINNLVGASDVTIFGDILFTSQVHISNSTGALCDFASSFQSLQQYYDMTPLCISAMEVTCTYDLADQTTSVPVCRDFSSLFSRDSSSANPNNVSLEVGADTTPPTAAPQEAPTTSTKTRIGAPTIRLARDP
jgi:hypothetical protein